MIILTVICLLSATILPKSRKEDTLKELMVTWKNSSRGFTIIELLIVIVIIAILAAITLVAYNQITSRAYDAAVQSDLKADAKAVELYMTDNSAYPTSYANLSSMITAGYPLRASKSAYATTGNNFIYCQDGPNSYAIAAQSKSGTAWYVSDEQRSPKNYSASWSWTGTVATICPNISGSSAGTWGYTGGAWNAIIQ